MNRREIADLAEQKLREAAQELSKELDGRLKKDASFEPLYVRCTEDKVEVHFDTRIEVESLTLDLE